MEVRHVRRHACSNDSVTPPAEITSATLLGSDTSGHTKEKASRLPSYWVQITLTECKLSSSSWSFLPFIFLLPYHKEEPGFSQPVKVPIRSIQHKDLQCGGNLWIPQWALQHPSFQYSGQQSDQVPQGVLLGEKGRKLCINNTYTFITLLAS